MADKPLPQVGLPQPGKRTSPIVDKPPADGGPKGGVCYFNGMQYSEGGQVCSGGRQLQCLWNGSWMVVGNC